ncbi:MAG: glycoside-pentoside-hexuronide (GPH):cation symporter [Clostridiales bacterium]|nr:glycoside-pentoside-hexuronide (GPH):cation symporter [Clostridiales bacterium]
MENSMQKVNGAGKFGYLCGGLSYSMCLVIPTFLIYYSTESLGIAIGSVTLMMTLVKILDAVTDIISGMIIDKTNTKYGKARPWFLRASIPYAISIILLFAVPRNLGTIGQLIFMAIFYALSVSVFGTLIGVARYAIVPRMTNDKKEQGTLGALGDGIGVVFMGFAMAVTFTLVAKMGYSMTFGIYAIVALISGILCFLLTRERTEEISDAIEAKKTAQKTSLKEVFKTTFTNKYALLLLIVVTVQSTAAQAYAVSGTYFFTYVMGDVNLYSKAMTIALIGGIIGMFFCAAIIRKIGEKTLYIIGGVAAFICYILLLTRRDNVTLVVVVMGILMVFAQNFLCACFASFSSSAVLYGEAKTGVRAEGLTSSVINISIKAGTAIATAGVGFIMNRGGYVEGGVEQTEVAIQSICGASLYFPMIMFVAATLLVIFFYRIEKDLKKLKTQK